MKNIILFCLLLNGSLCLPINASAISDSTIIAIITAQNDSIKSLRKGLIEVTTMKDIQIEFLQQNIQQASDTISRQNSLFDAFSYVYTVIGIIITLLIALPLIHFFGVIRPIISDARNEIVRAQNAMDAAEKKIEEKISTILDDFSRKRIDQSIGFLTSADSDLQTDAIVYFRTIPYSVFTTGQLFQIFTVLKDSLFRHPRKEQLIQIVAAEHSLIADEYFCNFGLYDKEQKVLGQIFVYFTINGFANYSKAFISFFEKSGKSKSEAFIEMLLRLLSPYPAYIEVLLNDATICNWLSGEDKIIVKKELSHPKYESHGLKEAINDCLLIRLTPES